MQTLTRERYRPATARAAGGKPAHLTFCRHPHHDAQKNPLWACACRTMSATVFRTQRITAAGFQTVTAPVGGTGVLLRDGGRWLPRPPSLKPPILPACPQLFKVPCQLLHSRLRIYKFLAGVSAWIEPCPHRGRLASWPFCKCDYRIVRCCRPVIWNCEHHRIDRLFVLAGNQHDV